VRYGVVRSERACVRGDQVEQAVNEAVTCCDSCMRRCLGYQRLNVSCPFNNNRSASVFRNRICVSFMGRALRRYMPKTLNMTGCTPSKKRVWLRGIVAKRRSRRNKAASGATGQKLAAEQTSHFERQGKFRMLFPFTFLLAGSNGGSGFCGCAV
jgi:hypothetical protein